MLKRTILSCALSLTSFCAAADTINNAWSLTPSSGRALLSATSANANLGIFSGDAMQPLIGNQESFIFGDLAGDYATDATYLMSPGIGYRGIVNNQIFGAYAFSDYEKTSLGENFWVLSPGVEWITPNWDAHVNAYFPTTKSQQNGSPVFASTLGDNSQVSFEENTNNQYDERVQPYDIIGNGVDTEIGYSFAGKDHLKSRAYLGSYYYQPPSETENILGATLGYEQALTKNLSFSVFNSYDEVNHYAMGIGLTLILGGNSNEYSSDVQTRLLDPVQRHIGVIDTGAGTYDQQTTEDIERGLQYDNVYFVSETQTGNGDGTYGNSATLTQDNLDAIYAEDPEGSRIYIQGGSDAVYQVNASTTNGDLGQGLGLYVYSGQDFYGRSPDYTAPAASNEQPVISVDGSNLYNGFIVYDTAENTFSDLTINNYSAQNDVKGILVYNETGDQIINVNNTNIYGVGEGIYAESDSTGTLTINTNNSTFNENFTGIFAKNNTDGTLVINATDSEFNDNYVPGGSADKMVGINAWNNGNGDMTINAVNSQFNNNGVAVDNASYTRSAGIWAENDGTGTLTITATNSEFNGNGTATNSSSADSSYGIYALNVSSGVLNITANNSQFDGNGATDISSSSAYSAGIYMDNQGAGTLNITANNSQFNGNGSGSTITGIASGLSLNNTGTGATATANITNSSVENNGSYGIYGDGNTTGETIIHYTDEAISGNPSGETNADTSSDVTWHVTP